MVCGTTSSAGKSFLATALARWYSRRGMRVAPFKAQNMSNNARVVAGGEIGSAQYFQALAAGAVPDVRMNPVLLKPESDTHSQVVVLGRPDPVLSATPWRERSARIWPVVTDSLASLRSEYDLVVIEGAGSPAEINLQSDDVVNMRVAEASSAATLIITDIDRGGAFAHLYGTYELLEPHHRRLIRGFVLNRFRGDLALLAPAPERLQSLTGVPTLGVLPMWWGHGLPEEDGVYQRLSAGGPFRIAIVAYPRLSNADEFTVLGGLAGTSLIWARSSTDLLNADLVILPGSKHVANDLGWLRSQGLVRAIEAHIAADRPLLAICGGLQMLGRALEDPHGVEGSAAGLDLLPYSTEYAVEKKTEAFAGRFRALSGYWRALSGVAMTGYEIRHGVTRLHPGASLEAALPNDIGWHRGNVLALYAHGLFENSEVVRALFGISARTLDDTLDGLADFVDVHLGSSKLDALLR